MTETTTTTTADTVHVFTDAQFQALLALIAPKAPSTVAKVEAAPEEVLAAIKKLIADAEGTIGHVHGAAKALQADVKSNKALVLVGLIATAALALHVLQFVGVHL